MFTQDVCFVCPQKIDEVSCSLKVVTGVSP